VFSWRPSRSSTHGRVCPCSITTVFDLCGSPRPRWFICPSTQTSRAVTTTASVASATSLAATTSLARYRTTWRCGSKLAFSRPSNQSYTSSACPRDHQLEPPKKIRTRYVVTNIHTSPVQLGSNRWTDGMPRTAFYTTKTVDWSSLAA